MYQMYKAEIGRFARWAVGFGILHLAILFLLDRTFPWMRDDGEIAVVAAFAYGVLGALLGFYQSATYTRLTQWVALLHRPLAPWRILTAVQGASATILFAAVVVPLLLFTASLTMQAGRVVDARHWTMVVAGGLIALIGLGVGSYLALAPRRYGWTTIVAASVWTVGSLATGSGALILHVFVLVILSMLLVGAFKPDRSLLPSSPALLSVTAGVAAVTFFYLLVLGGGIAYQLGLAAIGRNPETNVPRPGGIVEAFRSDGRDVFATALGSTRDTQGSALRADLAKASFKRLPLASTADPTRGELMNSGPVSFTSARDNIRWTFSHDRNAFVGLRIKDRREVGHLVTVPAFEEPPVIVGAESMTAGGRYYKLARDEAGLRSVFELARGERIVAKPTAIASYVAVMSDRALYLVRANELEQAGAPTPHAVIPLPGPVGDLQRIDVAEMPEHLLISFLLGRDGVDGPARASQRIVSITPNGEVRTIAERLFAPEYSDVLRFRPYIISPAFRAISASIARVGSSSARTAPTAPIDVPANVWIVAGLLSLAAAFAVLIRATQLRLSKGRIAAWTIAAAVLGIPMLVVFMVLVRPQRLTANP